MPATMRKTVGARELKTRLGRYLRAVRSGAIIVVTDRGEPMAELRPVPRGAKGMDARLDELAALGMLTKGSGEPLAPFEPLRLAGTTLSGVIQTERDDRFR